MKLPENPDASVPIEKALPPGIVATPSDVRAEVGEEINWWLPGWRDTAKLIGWRFVYLTPLVLLLMVLAGAVFLRPLRTVLFLSGIHLMLFIGGVAISLTVHFFRIAAHARKEPFCIHCGYNLTGLPDNYRCPECGRPYEWRVIDEYRRDPMWFQRRWKMQKRLPTPSKPFEAGSVRKKPRDGTV